jgi:hypothetical protein
VLRTTNIIKNFPARFTDHRDPDLIERSVGELVAQRVYALALGYEDLNDDDELRNDPLLAVLVGKDAPTGENRVCGEHLLCARLRREMLVEGVRGSQ